jgi:hypothetical protein
MTRTGGDQSEPKTSIRLIDLPMAQILLIGTYLSAVGRSRM